MWASSFCIIICNVFGLCERAKREKNKRPCKQLLCQAYKSLYGLSTLSTTPWPFSKSKWPLSFGGVVSSGLFFWENTSFDAVGMINWTYQGRRRGGSRPSSRLFSDSLFRPWKDVLFGHSTLLSSFQFSSRGKRALLTSSLPFPVERKKSPNRPFPVFKWGARKGKTKVRSGLPFRARNAYFVSAKKSRMTQNVPTLLLRPGLATKQAFFCIQRAPLKTAAQVN